MRWLRLLFHTLGATFSLAFTSALAAVLAALLGLAWWVQSTDSLPRSLGMAARFLPAGQSLQWSEVSGSLLAGGRAGHLVWQDKERRLELQDLSWSWDWHALLDGEFRATAVHASVAFWEDRSLSSDAPITPFTLPLRVDLPFVVDRLEWRTAVPVALQSVQGRYRFDGQSHTVNGGKLQLASGQYTVDARLQAQAPGALSLQARGEVQAPLPASGRNVNLIATGSVEGTLFGKDAALQALLEVQPAGSASRTAATRVHVQATLQPAQRQPVVSADARWTQLDLAALWPGAPQTLLTGEAQVAPDGAGWRGDVQLKNVLEGPLNRGRLPLQSASASLLYRDGLWQLSQVQALVAGGRLEGQGGSSGTPARWSAKGRVQDVDPARWDTRWTLPLLGGDFQTRQSGEGVAFDMTLSGSRGGAASGVALQAEGLWQAPELQLKSLRLQSPQAQLNGQMRVNVQTLAAQGALEASAPGLRAALSGSAGPAAGQGQGTVQVSDARALRGWLESVPYAGNWAQGLALQGAADLKLIWQGGWQNQGAGLNLELSAQSPRLLMDQGTQFSDLRLDARGSLQDLEVHLQGRAQSGAVRMQWQSGSNWAMPQSGQWRGQVASLQAEVLDGLQKQPWTLNLDRPVEVEWQRSALLQQASLAAGSLRWRGPGTGAAQVSWEPVRWSQPIAASGAGGGNARWTSVGRLEGVPLAWLEALGQTRLANLGLRGDLILGGQWEARAADRLQLQARVQRTSGDLQLTSTDSNTGALAAGIREASLEVRLDQDAVQAQAVWASEAAGQVRAEFSTRVSTLGGWHWPDTAPVQGHLQASLPRVGVWSMFAPVGWRIQGTLETQASLSGTRAQPQWKGSLEARDMAIRSVVDGIDLSNGLMRLTLDGQHMDIAAFNLSGAGGAAGGQISATGSVDWLPSTGQGALTRRVRMAVDARAQAFRVTARPDQRLVVSGNLSARLADARLAVRGALTADQALFVMSEDTAPQLGSDVVVRRGKVPIKEAPATPADPASRWFESLAPDLQITLDPGANFQVQGHGLLTRLAGQLTLKTVGQSFEPHLTGELRAVNGSYKAYGQRLTIEEGTLRFTGPYDNPALDIRAVRPNLQQVVGVQVGGTAQIPLVRLFSEPDLPEIEQLSWLILGRSGANGGAQAALLQQAAISLLSGRGRGNAAESLINAFGLDEVSLGQTAVTNLDGTAGTEASLKFGKRLSRDFYVAYERSLAGTLGTLYVFYDLSRRFTLRGESGATNAVDLIFTTRYD